MCLSVYFYIFFRLTAILPCLSVHDNVSSVFLPFFSLTMKYSDTNLEGPSTPKHSCVTVPLSCCQTGCLPAHPPLISTNKTASSSTHLLHPLFLSFPLLSLTLSRDGSNKDKGQTKSQRSCEHLLWIFARSLRRSVLHLISLSASGERHSELQESDILRDFRKHLCWIKNTHHMLETERCDVANSRHNLSPVSKVHSWHKQRGVYWHNILLWKRPR